MPSTRRLSSLSGRTGTIQSVLDLSAEHAAGAPRRQGKRRAGAVVRYGRQTMDAMLARLLPPTAQEGFRSVAVVP